MAGSFTAKVNGLAELRAALLELSPKLRRRALRNALAAGGRVFRDQARRLAPVLAAPIVRRGTLVRQPGTLRKALAVRTSKIARRAGDVGVFVNVRPAKSAARGRNSPNDPYYWRFVEFGTSRMSARPFLRPAAANAAGEALRRIEQTLGPQIKKLNVKGATL
jgi:HK97 gp10 family phage protein